MILECLQVGPLEANCYLVACPESLEGVVIDPGGDAPQILAAIERLRMTVRCIFNTHGHVDHVAANAEVREATGARLYIHERDRAMIERPDPMWSQMVGGVAASAPGATYDEGDAIQVGSLAFRVLHTPGHSLGGVCLSVGDELFTGDTLFAGGVGRTDLPGGSSLALERSLRRLLDEFNPATRVHPGHGPSSTIGEQARTNPWLIDLA
ncbi:MAG TPA: MBL fold metallo-hydrolase [Armatimonadota bacterium]|nr:MBL fold metallo-hydrolase [Armatimonadota bacterium]